MPTIKLLQRKPREVTVNKREYQGIYNTKIWKRLRATKVRNNPVCEECEKKGITRMVDEVHHIVPFECAGRMSVQLAYDYDNLISLCFECHKKAHFNLHGGRFVPGYVNPDVEFR